MFFSGSLQEGIGSALQNSKAVVCFVHDEGEISTLWEDTYFQDSTIVQALEQNAVVLKLDSNSQEAGFLKFYHPIEEPPVVTVIRNGQLKDSLDNNLPQDAFSRRLLEALGLSAGESQVETTPEPSDSQVPEPPDVPENTTAPSGTSGTLGTSHSENVRAMLVERKARLEAQKKASEAKQKAERTATAKARRDEAEASVVPDSKRANELKYAQQQRQRQKDARAERERILRLVENDKAERREREERRREQAKAAQEAGDHETKGAQNETLPTSSHRPSGNCALQIRLLDGTSIRKTFEHSATLSDNVRPWVDAERTEGDIPYTFKQINTPLQNISIDVSEEGQTLQNIGLTPSATLVLVPVKGFSDAYSAENAGIISRGLSSGYGLVSSGVGLVGSAVGKLLGSGADQSTPATADGSSEPAAQNSNFRTLQDHKPDDDRQFYNGNQLNFEPRRDDDSKED